ncbi:MAG TPA: phosphohydrolase [Gammaproteobacteria bacterium]|jgi:HD-like signal output (HDOD) protein|nr:phosphohydrolase [Gammaproteobacteria bacterium]
MTDSREELIAAVQDVPLLSPSVSQLLEVTADPKYNIADLIRIIKHDAVLTARLLRVVNSAAYALPVEVETVDRAVAMLGSRVVVGLALGGAGDGLFTRPLDGYDSNGEGIWRHDLFSAIAGRYVGLKATTDFTPDLAFTGGLLLDIGKAVMSQFLVGKSAAMLADIANGTASDYLEEETRLLGLDHAELGYELAKCWQLPEVLQNAIRYHHKPSQASEIYRPLCYAVHIGDTLAMMAGHSAGSDAMQYQLESGYDAYFKLDEQDIGMIMLQSGEEFMQLEEVMALVMEA